MSYQIVFLITKIQQFESNIQPQLSNAAEIQHPLFYTNLVPPLSVSISLSLSLFLYIYMTLISHSMMIFKGFVWYLKPRKRPLLWWRIGFTIHNTHIPFTLNLFSKTRILTHPESSIGISSARATEREREKESGEKRSWQSNNFKAIPILLIFER